MVKISEVIVVEGRYDKNTLSQIVDAVIIETSGFGVFSDKQKLSLLRKLASRRVLIIMTDSDRAGFLIRNHLKGAIDPKLVKHAYIPDIRGRERRKSSPSKEGKLGVEGMRADVIIEALRRAGATIEDDSENVPEQGNDNVPEQNWISKADLYQTGLTGGNNSTLLRKQLLAQLELPENLSTNGMLDVLNALMTRGEFLKLTNVKEN